MGMGKFLFQSKFQNWCINRRTNNVVGFPLYTMAKKHKHFVIEVLEIKKPTLSMTSFVNF